MELGQATVRRSRGSILLVGVLALTMFGVTACQQSGGLRNLASARGMLIGAAARNDLLSDATYSGTLAREFNVTTPETEMKWDILHPTATTYNFAPADRVVAFAQAHGMK